MDMPRVLVYDHLDNQVCELSPNDVFSLMRTEEINGQNRLEITCSRPLAQEQRVLVRDMMGLWREYVVTGIDEAHLSGEHATGTYFCEWSLKHDLLGVTVVDKRPGVQTPVLARVALDDLLSYTRRWSVGNVTVTALGGQSLYWISAWEGLGKIVDEWGGEVMADIAVSSSGVISRKLSLLEAMGEQASKRRFDFGYDLTGIQRKVEEEPLYCRIYPRGKGEETDSGGYGRRITIESANNGVAYIENAETAQAIRLPDGLGGYEYPSCVIENSEIDDPAELKSWAESVSDDYTTPKVTYTGTVEQFAAAGMSAKGVSLGDAVQCADREFAPNAALRVNGRIVKIVVDERDPCGAKLTIGYVSGGLASLFGDIGKTLRNTASAVEAMNGGTMSTADYLERLIDRINMEINAAGGYTYIKPGEGIWVYDKAEDQNPTQVVRIMGGSISVASAKTSQGEWKWSTLLTGRDGILASAVVAAQLTAGHIGSAASGNFWNLDTGELSIRATTKIGGKTAAEIAGEAVDGQTQQDVFDTLTDGGQTQGIYLQNGKVYINGSYIASGVIDASLLKAGKILVKDANGNVVFSADMETGEVQAAGFTATRSALFNGLQSIDGIGEGVYLGTDGIASSSAHTFSADLGEKIYRSVAISDGVVTGRLDGEPVGFVEPAACFDVNMWWRGHDAEQWVPGLRLRGKNIAIHTPCLSVSNSDSPSAAFEPTLNVDSYSSNGDKVWATQMTVGGVSGNVVSARFADFHPLFTCGMLTGYNNSPCPGIGSDAIDIPLKGYVDDRVSDLEQSLKAWVGQQGYLTAASTLPQHTHDWSEVTSKPSIPAVSQSGGDLYIRT